MTDSRLELFIKSISSATGQNFQLNAEGYRKFHQWSAEHSETFHSLAWDFANIIGDKGKTIISDPEDMLKAEFFPDSKISFAENQLEKASTHPDDLAIISRVAGKPDRLLTWKELYDEVSKWNQALEKICVGEGDRIATYLPHTPEAYILMMAVACRGAIFSSVGTEMGADATASRFEQVQPKVLIAADGYEHCVKKGDQDIRKEESRIDLIKDIQARVSSIQKTIIVPNFANAPDIAGLDEQTVLVGDLMKDITPQKINFVRRSFNHPLFIMFSSGSTGKPKCFVHGTGNMIIKHAIEHQLQCDVHSSDRIFFHSTTSWMMFNWLASGLSQGATIMIYDGNPAYPDAAAQLRFAAEYQCTHLGTAAAIVQDVWAKGGVDVKSTLDLSALRSVMYTGSVLSDKGFDYIHDHIKQDIEIEGVCGGTDFVGCYAAGNSLTETLSGQLKGAVLGMDIDVWDDNGQPAKNDTTGELVIKSPFVSRPLYFWGDDKTPAYPAGERFTKEYFEYFTKTKKPVWRHGDAVKKTPEGQWVVEGRSDATLNQGGVRIGTQQLYDALKHPDLDTLLSDSLAANFKDDTGGDHTALFLVFKDSRADIDDELKKKVKSIISDSVGRLSTPHEIIAVPYVLKTPNGKKAEKPTSKALKGEDVKGAETYGVDETSGAFKAALYSLIGEKLQSKPAYKAQEGPAGSQVASAKR